MTAPIPLTDPAPYTVPPAPGFAPDRLGVRSLTIDVDRATNAYRTNLVLCPATADAWGPADLPAMSSADLVAELLAAPDGADKVAALEAVGRMAGDVLTIGAFLRALRAAPTRPDGE